MVGICSYGGYVPRYRLNRGMIYKSMGWINPSTIGNAKGEKAVANFDEDSVTMAVAAGIDALVGLDSSAVEGVYFASTTLPYKERSCAGIINSALGFDDKVRAADFTGSSRAGTTALMSALESIESGRVKSVLTMAAECRLGKPGSPQEMIFGDAAAALLIGEKDVVAEYKGFYSTTYDFVDRYRGEYSKYDRQWEDRWIRDYGYESMIPEVVNGLLDKYGLKITDFAKVIYPCHYPAARKSINKKLSITPEIEQGNLMAEVGEAGSALSLLMFVQALENAMPGDKILVVGFGSGCDALYFEVNENIKNVQEGRGASKSLADKTMLDNYTKYLVWRNILPGDIGMRAEEDIWTRWTLVWRKRKEILGLCGSKCKKCGAIQYPQQKMCVNPNCGAVDEMEDYRLADKIGHIVSYTGDMLAATVDPPAVYGHVAFEGGGKFMFDFTDCNIESLAVGMPVRMSFRKKYADDKRDMAGYFWKAVPVKEVQ